MVATRFTAHCLFLSATWAIMKPTVYWLVHTDQSSVSAVRDRSLLSMAVKPVT